ncbi:hypothetical protein [Rhodococcus sp. PD04]|uniref:hypothetical protein n=1 Tax=Rhodococcus sp. PD04 TaxID=3109594 RepID=UPI002DDAB5D8|nr:hypothetical protein [Rhodococcus sp. PD04]WSE25763.1 hypothetical protein U9J23_27490 [Rhodococcus sp. PD04]
MTATMDAAGQGLATKAARIQAMRARLSALDPDQSRLFAETAAAASDTQSNALDELTEAIESRGFAMGFYRESRPRAFLAHEAVCRDARLPGVFPYGAEAAAVSASAAILYENEALVAGHGVRSALLAPVVAILGPERDWMVPEAG